MAVAEQTETSKQMNKRISSGGGGADENELKVVKREVAQIYSMGTFFKMEGSTSKSLNEGSIDYDTKFVLSYYQDH